MFIFSFASSTKLFSCFVSNTTNKLQFTRCFCNKHGHYSIS